MNLLYIFLLFIAFVILVSIRVIYQYERGIKFTLGKFTSITTAGLTLVVPIFQSMQKVDIRIKTVDVPRQECITKDNVTVTVDAVVYYFIQDPKKAILNVENFFYATSQLAQTTMRNVVGEVSLDDLLAKREAISNKIKSIVDEETDPWGIKVENVDLKHVELPDDLKRMMAREAESEREKRGVIIKSQGEVIAAQKFAEAAVILHKSPGAMQLRNLQTINDISSDPSTKFIFAPMDIFSYFKK